VAEVTAASAIKAFQEMAHDFFKDFTEEDHIAFRNYCLHSAITPTYELFPERGDRTDGRSKVDQADNRYV
jgi:hypothetical protein